MSNVHWFKDILNGDITKVGYKGSNVSQMYNADIPVPDGFCVTTDAYRDYMVETAIDEDIYHILDKVDVDDASSLHDASERIQDLILNTEIPARIKNDLLNAYDNMNVNIDIFKAATKKALDMIKAGRDLPFVAVRTSAFIPGVNDKLKGSQNTLLNVRGNDTLIRAIQKCWASMFNSKAILYRVKNNLDHSKMLVPIIVQKMVKSEKSGTVNTSGQNIVIEAGLGLGEVLVSGGIQPDVYVVDKEDFSIKENNRGRQDYMVTLDINLKRNVRRSLDPGMASMQKLTEGEIVMVAKLAKMIESFYEGTPKYIEFAIEGPRLFIVSAENAVLEIEEKEEVQEEQTEVVQGPQTESYVELETSEEPQDSTEGNSAQEESSNLETITEIRVVVNGSNQTNQALETGADGVGLLKCYIDPSFLNESRKEDLINNLVGEIRTVARAFEGSPVWYRVFNNMVEAQFLAVKKLHDEGFTNVGVMVPLVNEVEQIRMAKEALRKVGLEALEEVEFGIVIETPAAVLLIKDLCKEGLDFVSINTDELAKHTLGGDSRPLHPAVLKSLKRVISECKEYNVETSLDGKAANNMDLVDWAVKVGVDSITPNIEAVTEVRRIVSRAEKRLLLGVARKNQ